MGANQFDNQNQNRGRQLLGPDDFQEQIIKKVVCKLHDFLHELKGLDTKILKKQRVKKDLKPEQ